MEQNVLAVANNFFLLFLLITTENTKIERSHFVK